MTNPRVLVVAPRLDIGGTEVHLARVLPKLRQAGLDVSLFTIARGGRLEPDFIAAGVPVLGIEVAGPRLLRSLRAAHVLRQEIRRLRPDILQFFLPEPSLIGSLAAAGLASPLRIMSRRSLSHYRRNHLFLAWLDRRINRSMNSLIGNSSAVAAELIEECGDADKVGIIHNGIEVPPTPDAQSRAACRARLGTPDDAFVIVMIANLFPYKGHADLIAALGLVRGRLRGPWRLLLIGRDEGIGAVLKTQSETLGINANILWLGERSDSQELLAAADLGILASHQEGFSNSLIEMMAQAMPVVATSVGGNIDAVVDGESGRLVPAKDPAALGEAIADLYEDADTQKRMGDAARSRVERLFSLELCVHRYLNLYRGLIANKTIPAAQLIDPPGAGGVPSAQRVSSNAEKISG
jgi:glycosyltransferase involved in cell wall biosynthesis